jgi:hypothetical protein
MNKEKYEELMLRFAKELHDVGVTENMTKIMNDKLSRAPNVIGTNSEESTDRFVYRHEGYMIEAIRIVKLSVKKCGS